MSTLPPIPSPPDLVSRVDRLTRHVKRLERGGEKLSNCGWFFILLLVGLFVTAIILATVLPYRPPPYKRVLVPPVHRSRTRSGCTIGETFNETLSLCEPNFHVPMAFDSNLMDPLVGACESMYQSVCGRWISTHSVQSPEGLDNNHESRSFSYAHHRNQILLKQIVQQPNTAINDFYRSCLLAHSSLAAGILESTLEYKHILSTISLRVHADLPVIFGRLANLGYTVPFSLSIERHPLENRTIPLFAYDSFPDTLTEQQIILLLQNSRQVTGFNLYDIQRRVEGIIRVNDKLKRHRTRLSQLGTENYTDYILNHLRHDLFWFQDLPQAWQLKGHAPVTSAWQLFFNGHLHFEHDQPVWVLDMPYFQWLFSNDGIASLDIFDWKAYVEFSVLYHGHEFVPELPDNAYVVRKQSRRGGRIPRQLNTSSQSTEDKCTQITQHMIPGLIAKRFLQTMWPSTNELFSVKQDVLKIVQKIRQSMSDAIGATAWLSNDDRAILKSKVDNIIIRVAEPDRPWFEEPFAERISPDRYNHNLDMVRRYRVQQNLRLWQCDGDQFDRSALAPFVMPLSMINAYYSPSSNTITVLAGILSTPFYDVRYNEVSKYAILGSIVGHEMSHALDAGGLYWSRSGILQPHGILSPQGMLLFKNQTECLLKEYACGISGGDYHNRTLSENIADLTGFSLAYYALTHYTETGTLNSLSDRQYFFLILAQAFCETRISSCSVVSDDPHAFAKDRIDRVFKNMASFTEAFGCFAGQEMHKENVCKVY